MIQADIEVLENTCAKVFANFKEKQKIFESMEHLSTEDKKLLYNKNEF